MRFQRKEVKLWLALEWYQMPLRSHLLIHQMHLLPYQTLMMTHRIMSKLDLRPELCKNATTVVLRRNDAASVTILGYGGRGNIGKFRCDGVDGWNDTLIRYLPAWLLALALPIRLRHGYTANMTQIVMGYNRKRPAVIWPILRRWNSIDMIASI